MKIEETVFERKKIVPDKALAFGFVRRGDGLFYARDFLAGDFHAEIRVAPDGSVSGSVIDVMNDEEYAPLRAEGMRGAYVSGVRAAYTAILGEIADKCCDDYLFASEQANRIANAVKATWGIEPDFPFDEERYRAAAVFRHGDNGKWFGLLMPVKKSVLAGESASDRIDVMNLKADPERIPALWKVDGIYPAYHMNRKYWISLALDGRVADDLALALIGESFRLTEKKKAR
ncbi:MAG: MmcQ/YjbR family DNA-binding protein [Clostridia bacterium]|nr:MmcQ/YjbR family DNA-binding protein [Clostridia bacterium]